MYNINLCLTYAKTLTKKWSTDYPGIKYNQILGLMIEKKIYGSQNDKVKLFYK